MTILLQPAKPQVVTTQAKFQEATAALSAKFLTTILVAVPPPELLPLLPTTTIVQ